MTVSFEQYKALDRTKLMTQPALQHLTAKGVSPHEVRLPKGFG